jgi:hypothetical protein
LPEESDHAGNLNGTSNYDGTYYCGTVFELAHSGKLWTKSVIYSFTGGSDGASPEGGVLFDSAGKLFGVTEASAYELSPVGDAWKETTLFSFNAKENEIHPTISLVVAPAYYIGSLRKGGDEKDCTGTGRFTPEVFVYYDPEQDH